MSSDSDVHGPPTNVELAQRTARIEEQVDHVSETVDRIEDRLDDQHEDLVDDVEDHDEKIGTMFPVFRAMKYAVPIGVTVIGSLAAIGVI